jgi:hypothetical protein
MSGRYINRGTIEVTKREMFKQIKERRNEEFISLYGTPRYERLHEFDFENLNYESYIWSRGDNFYKLAHEFYGDVSIWWVIPLFNHTPTEQHISLGDEIFIPLEPEAIISLLGV